jgi:N-acetylneuraminic acid mutarotase
MRRGIVFAMSSLLLCAAAAGLMSSGTPLALSQHEAPAGALRTLTLEERVSYQRAIEEVYWRHRIWPKENANPKPSLDAVMSQAQLEKKVKDYLRSSQALEGYWQRPITGEQLQAEMDRMARNTKQPEVLQELFEALGNDPFVIAECLARPALADRLITNWYAYDQRIHSELKQRAETELQTRASLEQMKQLSGKYSEMEVVKNDPAQAKQNRDSGRNIKLNGHEWDETAQKLSATFPRIERPRLNTTGRLQRRPYDSAESYEMIPTGKLSPLQEDESRYYVTAVIKKTNDHLKLATVSWLKKSLQSWLTKAENQFSTAVAVPADNYTLPTILGGGCVEDTWTATAGPADGRAVHTAVWTGSEMIVWGGLGPIPLNTGGRYNPSTDSWVTTTTTNAPAVRSYHTAVWTGTEMIVWGGLNDAGPLNSGGRYNPITDSWIPTTISNAPDARYIHTAVWTGSEMIVWGGFNGNYLNTGGRYNPGTRRWTATSTTNPPDARQFHTAVWTGSEMIVWGGYGNGVFNTGWRYNPVTNNWIATSTTNPPDVRYYHTAVWTGNEMIVWGGTSDGFNALGDGARYDPGTNSWTATSGANAPAARQNHTAVWSGSEMIVWGGYFDSNTGGRYNPSSDSWVNTGTANVPLGRRAHTAVWTGSEMIVWGGNPANPDSTCWIPAGNMVPQLILGQLPARPTHLAAELYTRQCGLVAR